MQWGALIIEVMSNTVTLSISLFSINELYVGIMDTSTCSLDRRYLAHYVTVHNTIFINSLSLSIVMHHSPQAVVTCLYVTISSFLIVVSFNIGKDVPSTLVGDMSVLSILVKPVIF